jgi:cytochrome bd ubiquinol oxidase subunit I
MDLLALSRWQFALTTIYHFFFVPLTLGLGWFVVIFETIYARTGNETYKRLTKFWGKLFVINYAMGVVTGLVQEFQFGMNWSEYSRYVGDIFGVPLAIEGLLAFFLESTLLGVWIFGWERLSRKAHALMIWLVAIGSNLSAVWILIANGFMQHPVGYVINNGRAELVDFVALITNPRAWWLISHTLAAGLVTASFFVLAISAYHLARKQHVDLFRRSFKTAAIVGLIFTITVGVMGHIQGSYLREVQPMAAAASEALYETSDPAPFSVVAIFDSTGKEVVWSLEIPKVLSWLYFFKFSGEIEGIDNIQAAYADQYGQGDYVPIVALAYWTFRFMVALGFLMVALTALALYLPWKKWPEKSTRWLRWAVWIVFLPYLANSFGWILTETGRQPWIVHGLLKTADGVSPQTAAMVFTSLVGYVLLYAALMVADVYLLVKYAKAGPAEAEGDAESAAADPTFSLTES